MKNSIMAIVALCAMNALAAVYDVASPDGTLTANIVRETKTLPAASRISLACAPAGGFAMILSKRD